MKDWLELEGRFKELVTPLQYHRLDYQWGAAGEYWRIAGGPTTVAARQFATLASVAGRMLHESPAPAAAPEVLAQEDPVHGWFQALRHHSGLFRMGEVAWQIDDDGSNAGALYTGSIDRPAEASALVCLQFAAEASNRLERGPIVLDTPLAATDPITGLLNRAALESELPLTIGSAESSGLPLSMVMVDIDKFKSINDSHGHPTGDTVLAGVATSIKSVVEGKGRVYRFGGEEFAILLPNHNGSEAVAVAERARQAVETAKPAGILVTASFGISTFPDQARSQADLAGGADKALYDAKNRGRNLVRVFGEPPPTAATRETKRKLPAPGTLTDQEKANLRVQHFRGFPICCPRDEALLAVQEIQSVSEATPRLRLLCKYCGLMETI